MKNISDELENNLTNEMIKLATFLAEKKIIIDFNPNQIGLNEHFHVKYYLDFTKAILN